MIDHVSVAVSDLAASAAFYDKVFEPLGMIRIADLPTRVGYGKKYPEFWINARSGLGPVPDDTGHHICLRAPSRAAVVAFYKEACSCGGTGEIAPEDREATVTNYFRSFIRDLDGNKIEAATFPRAGDA